MRKHFLLAHLILIMMLSACSIQTTSFDTPQTEHDDYDYELIFPSAKYPETALHVSGAIAQGATDVCTIDRKGADQNRKESLAGIATKKGYDRDEWPMAMCEEGGKGASVAYIDSSDNRGAGSWVGNQLSDYPDGTKVLFIVEKPKNLFPTSSTEAVEPTIQPIETAKPTETIKPIPTDMTTFRPIVSPTANPTIESSTGTKAEDVVFYKNCTAVREAGANPIRKGEPGYSSKLDRDGDGVACE